MAALSWPEPARGESTTPAPSTGGLRKLRTPSISNIKARNGRPLLYASGSLIERGLGSRRIDFRLTCGRKSLDRCTVTLTWVDGSSERVETVEGVWVPAIYMMGGAPARVQTARLELQGPGCATQEMLIELRGNWSTWKIEYVVTGKKAPCEMRKTVYDLHRNFRPPELTSRVPGCAPVLIDPDDSY